MNTDNTSSNKSNKSNINPPSLSSNVSSTQEDPKLDFSSEHFDPAYALTVNPPPALPVPGVKPLDHLARAARLLPPPDLLERPEFYASVAGKRPAPVKSAVAVAATDSGEKKVGRESNEAPESPKKVTISETSKNLKPGATLMTLTAQGKAKAAAAAAAAEGKPPLKKELAGQDGKTWHALDRIMYRATRFGPLSLLMSALEARSRIRVTVRSAVAVRGTVEGYLRAFDWQWNLVLLQAEERATTGRWAGQVRTMAQLFVRGDSIVLITPVQAVPELSRRKLRAMAVKEQSAEAESKRGRGGGGGRGQSRGRGRGQGRGHRPFSADGDRG